MRLADTLRDQLEQEIVTGALRPGERLDEQSLAVRFNVSRTPIREALAQLASAGLVTTHLHRGSFVALLGLRDIVERFEMMAALEGMCGRLAARRITPDERRALLDAHAACTREAGSGDADTYYYENERFHAVIYDASHNGFLSEQSKQLHRRLKPYRRLQLRLAGRIGASLEEHGRIVEAILAGDGALAEQRLKEHVLIQGERLTDFVAHFEGLPPP